VTPDEKELRRALEARGGSPSAEFRARLSQALSSRPATPNLMPAVALAIAVVLTVTSVGILVASRGLQPREGPASNARVTSPIPTAGATPSPVPAPSSVVLSAASANVVWALVDYQHLYRSTDQGNHWEQRSVFAGPFRSASFIDEQEGWLLDAGSAATQCQGVTPFFIWHTVDAGLTWQQSPAKGIGASQCTNGIWFVDAKHGYVSAWDPNHQPTVYRTSDGGNSWAATTLQDPGYFKSQPGGFTLQVDWITRFGSTLYLEAFGSQNDPNLPHDNQFVLNSTDGGASWSLVTKVPSRAAVMVTESRWLDYTAPGQAMESVNGGQQFHPYASDFNLAATQLVFADANIGYAVGPGVVQQTTNGGAHWATLATPGAAPSASPSAIPMPSSAQLSAPSANVVWALVTGQYLFRSTDQGNTWQMRTPAPTSVKGGSPLISFVDATNGWELVPTSGSGDCTAEGTELWRTTDGAATWTLVSVTQLHPPAGTVPTERCKDALYFLDSTRGVLALGDTTFEPEFHGTGDGGVNWVFASLLPWTDKTYPFRIVSIKAFGDTVLAQERYSTTSHVYISTDGGQTWSVVRGTVPTQAMSNVAFLSPTHWLVLQPAALETTDAGKTWHPFAYSDEEAAGVPSVFVFADDKVGYATVRGDVRRTVDGGAHFVMVKNSWP
jgi:photosystem II stability/assembly factor-like uncharacterized protein